ncbi:MAG: 2-oxo acid dehydrogenase subunit E2 [Clostridiales Family XIII bacterium]|jgi:pyruvate/2-oxoglutarate dehydrogenase complex dihydrolipoamide acyltransferase (E2) component|nr:2-oxo acid dehydrogenase subunit E2 [Clostridiales Family XIII bacterium]
MTTTEGFERLSAASLAAVAPTAATVAVATAAAVYAAAGVPIVKMTPLARRIAVARGIDAATVQGRGYGGKVYAADVIGFADPAAPALAVAPTNPQPAYVPEGQVASIPIKTAFEMPGFLAALPPAPKVLPEETAQGSREAVSYAPAASETAAMFAPAETVDAADTTLPQKEEVVAEKATAETAPMASGAHTAEPAPETAVTAQQEAPIAGPFAAMRTAGGDIAGILRMNEARLSVASRTAQSAAQTAAATQYMETDATELLALQKRLNEGRDKQGQIPIAAFYLKSLAVCVREQERFRMRLADSGDAFYLFDGANIGIDTCSYEGAAIPVVGDADQKTLDGIAAEITALIEKAKRGRLSEDDAKGGVITLVDMSESSIYAFSPIINLPESAILGIGAPYRRLVMTERGIENRQFIMQALTYDHRVVGEGEAAEFQRRLKAAIEDPQPLAG